MSKSDLPTYYPTRSLADMEGMLRRGYLTKSGWLESAETKQAQRGGRPLPWFTYSAIEFLAGQISPDLRIFEYGGGQSSFWWAGKVTHVATVEHDMAFYAFINEHRPANMELILRTEGQGLAPSLRTNWHDAFPTLSDPKRTEQTFRSGQLNVAFAAYAQAITAFERNTFDIVVVDGMARLLSTWAAIEHFSNHGFIVFDNSDRGEYQNAYDLLQDAGYRRIDFWGLGPINPYQWCTSVFYQARDFTEVHWFPKSATGDVVDARPPTATSPAKSADPAIGIVPKPDLAPIPAADTEALHDALGILVVGYNRPFHLQAVLESLRLQDALNHTHVWLDGTQGRAEFSGANEHSIRIANRYNVNDINTHWGHLGIEKLMLNALSDMITKYDRILVLEDDCFPIQGAVEVFEHELSQIANQQGTYSVYGHHFGCEPAETLYFPRFQGWGWAAHSSQINRLLTRLKDLFLLSEAEYISKSEELLTPEVRRLLDVTPGRDVLNVIAKGFSWDSATALLAAQEKLSHKRTETPQVLNTGFSQGVGHFQAPSPRLRDVPYKMITLDEAWSHWDTESRPASPNRDSYGLDQLDIKILRHVGRGPGVFVEIGAHDGVIQSNSLLLEQAGWKGVLIEPCPASFARCFKTRPNATVINRACVPFDHGGDTVEIMDVGLMSVSSVSGFDDDQRAHWQTRGERFHGSRGQMVEVPAAPISQVFDDCDLSKIDLLILDVEGAEVAVLKGLDFARHAPRFVVCEDAYDDNTQSYLESVGYALHLVLNERQYTRDCLYIKQDSTT